MKRNIGLALLAPTAFAGHLFTQERTILPIRKPEPARYKELDVRNATPPKRFEVRAPEGAPNVVVVLIHDMGFGVSNAFAGPVSMPTLDKLANAGLRYNQFHTTSLSAPTQVALLTGYPTVYG